MKKTILLTSLLFTFLAMHAQIRWSVSCTGKTVLKNVSEDMEKNILKITNAALSKAGNITVTFHLADTSNIITLMADDENRSGLKSWENVTKPVTITNAELKALLLNRGKIYFYYTAIPKDPAKAALVRIRPVHVCTLALK